MRAKVFGSLIICLGISLAGCGTTAKQQFYFAAASHDGKDANYFKVKVRGCSPRGQADWRSGWYSRTAMDQLFSEMKADYDVSDELVATQQKKFQETSEKYYSALGGNRDDDAERHRKAMNSILAAGQAYHSLGATYKDAAENSGKRFVYRFTSHPSMFDQLIADTVESQRFGALIQSVVVNNSQAKGKAQSTRATLEAEVSDNEAILAQLTDLTTTLSSATGDEEATAMKGAIKLRLSMLGTSLTESAK